MEGSKVEVFLKMMLKEQLYCLGRVVARHNAPDDLVWELIKGFDLIFMKVKEQAEDSNKESNAPIYKMEPHPGIMYLLEKLEK